MKKYDRKEEQMNKKNKLVKEKEYFIKKQEKENKQASIKSNEWDFPNDPRIDI